MRLVTRAVTGLTWDLHNDESADESDMIDASHAPVMSGDLLCACRQVIATLIDIGARGLHSMRAWRDDLRR